MDSAGNSSDCGRGGEISCLDAHVHCYPPGVIADPAGWARRHGEPHWGRLVTAGPQGWADPEGLLRAMDRDGVEQVLLQAWYWQNPDNALRQNDWHAEWVGRYPGRVRACAAVHPDLKDPAGVLESARGWGACAVGECLPAVQSGAGWAHPGWEVILASTMHAGWPLCLHVTEPAGHDYPGRVETPLMELLDVIARHPQQKWLLAHWGGGLPFFSLNRKVRPLLGNVWYDTAASPLLYDARIWQSVVRLVGAERVLFGSDFPLRLYPRREPEPGWQGIFREMRASGLSDAQREAICRTNFQQLFG
jgi:predicted TIM-barrel fold metal-dependent hydrolase